MLQLKELLIKINCNAAKICLIIFKMGNRRNVCLGYRDVVSSVHQEPRRD